MVNERVYVGSAKNIRKRWKLHRTHLRMGIHHNRPLQMAWRKYGESAFVFDVLEFCDLEDLTAIEQKWLDQSGAYVRGVGFNVLATAFSSIGFKHSAETLVELSRMAKERDHPHLRLANEARKGLPAHNKGVPGKRWTDERRATASTTKGVPAWNKGVPHSAESKAAISAALLRDGQRRKYNEAQRAQVKEMRVAGATYKAIAEATGISLSQCQKIVHDNTRSHYIKGVGVMRLM